MKTSPAKSSAPVAAVALAAWMLSASAHAMPPLVRRTLGTITEVDPIHRRVVVLTEPHSKPLRLAFAGRTTIWRGSSKVTSAEIKRGQKVQVSYRLPLLGPDYASRIVLLSPSKTNNTNTQEK